MKILRDSYDFLLVHLYYPSVLQSTRVSIDIHSPSLLHSFACSYDLAAFMYTIHIVPIITSKRTD